MPSKKAGTVAVKTINALLEIAPELNDLAKTINQLDQAGKAKDLATLHIHAKHAREIVLEIKKKYNKPPVEKPIRHILELLDNIEPLLRSAEEIIMLSQTHQTG